MRGARPLLLMLLALSFVCFGNAVFASDIEEKEQALKEKFFAAEMAQPQILKIALVDCIAYALKNNSEIKVEKIEPLVSEQDVKIAESAFEPTFSAQASLSDNKEETPSILMGSHSRTGQLSTGVSGKLITGTQYSLDFLNTNYKDNSAILSVNPYYQMTSALTITQPIFKDFGISVNRAKITIANNNLDKSDQNLKKELIDTIGSVEEAYYLYVLYLEKYKTAEISLQRAKDLLAIVEKRYAKGMASSIDLLEAKTGVAEREDALLNMQQAAQNAADNLKYITGLIDDPQLWQAQIEPLDRPEPEKEEIDLVENLKQAFDYRPDYIAYKIDLKNQDIQILLKKNSLLPSIDLVGSLGINGLDEDYDQSLKADYKQWSAGVQVSVPWGMKEEKADYEKANLTKQQLLLGFERLQQAIILQVREAVRAVNISGEKIDTAKNRLDTQDARYKAIEKRFQQGLVSTHDMLEYQEDLSSAETNYIQSLIDYANSLVGLKQATGTTLVKNDITLEE
ncbi:MAG: TolC family protein [Candidatus Omnitrophica bacterium]|nr:TolC family protein [Candidatus Omnitrophota bacterium]